MFNIVHGGCREKEVARISRAEGEKAVDIITVYEAEEEVVMDIVWILWVVERVVVIVNVSGAEEAGAVDIITISRVGEEPVVDVGLFALPCSFRSPFVDSTCSLYGRPVRAAIQLLLVN